MDGQAGKDLQGSHSDSGTGTGAPSREGTFNCGTFVAGNGVQARKEGRRQIHIIAVERLLVIL